MAERKPLVLMRGMIAVPVGNLQEQLSYKGFSPGAVDNVFGLRTELAVRQFQASCGLPETGIVDAETWRLLFDGIPLPSDSYSPCDGERGAGSSAEDVGAAISGARQQDPSIQVSLAQRRLTIFRDGLEIAQYPVAVGKPATPTPVGNWSVLNKALNPGGVFGTRWMGFTRMGHGIHGTNQPQSVGHAVSNGCVRMYTPDVETLFSQINVGAAVRVVTGVTQAEIAPGTYVVRSGDTLYSIAQRFGTTVQALKSANALVTDMLQVGQVLRIPGPAGTPPVVTGRDYIVQPGDTLFIIARRSGTTVQALMAANNLTSTNIYVGQRLRIPGGSVTRASYVPGQAATTDASVYRETDNTQALTREYVVQPLDSLSAISDTYGVAIESLVEANNLTGIDIYPGQVLRIPY